MLDKFESLTQNPLDGIMVSASRRIEFANIFLQRMIGSNPNNIYDAIITATQSCLDAYKGNLSEAKLKEAIRISYTAELNDTADLFHQTNSRFEGYITSLYSRGNSKYLVYFPLGLSEYNKANQANTVILMDRLIQLNRDNQTDLKTTEYLDLYTGFKSRYANAFSVQKQADGIITNSRPAKDMLWLALKKQLFKNMVFIVYNNIDNPRVMLAYIEPSLLRFTRTTDGKSHTPVNAQIAALTSLVADITFTSHDTILLINHGTVSVFFYGAATANQAAPSVLSELKPGSEIEIQAPTIGAPTNKFLIVMNKDASVSADVEYALL